MAIHCDYQKRKKLLCVGNTKNYDVGTLIVSKKSRPQAVIQYNLVMKRIKIIILISSFLMLSSCSISGPFWLLSFSTDSVFEMKCLSKVLTDVTKSEAKKNTSDGFSISPYWGEIKGVILSSIHSNMGKGLNYRFGIYIDEKVRKKRKEVSPDQLYIFAKWFKQD